MQNRREYAYFRPVGPLRYMLSDRRGRERLGLYEYSQDGRMVLIGDAYGGKVVFWPTVEAIQDIIEERAEVSRVLQGVRWTTTGLYAPDAFGRLLCRLWLMRELGGRIGRLPRYLPYLNLYYVIRQHRFTWARGA